MKPEKKDEGKESRENMAEEGKRTDSGLSRTWNQTNVGKEKFIGGGEGGVPLSGRGAPQEKNRDRFGACENTCVPNGIIYQTRGG